MLAGVRSARGLRMGDFHVNEVRPPPTLVPRHLPRLDAETLGFTVHQLADFNVFAQNLGSVHCIKKYLARE
jgi:hypothetical protein